MKSPLNAICLTFVLSLGTISAAWSADFLKGAVAYESGDYATALREWTPLAKQGDADAQHNLGLMYANGRGVPQDYKTAVKWLRLAAEQGDASAQGTLGLLYGMGQGVPEDYVYAHMWFIVAASSGKKNAIAYRDKVAGMMTPSQLEKAEVRALVCVRNKYKNC